MPTAPQDHPLFIVVEGLDGAGTTTLASMLAETLHARDLRVLLTAEPTDGAFGRLLRRHLRGEITLDPKATALAFTADRADHLASTIRPALARGRTVVCDRYLLSTLAYQGAEGVEPAVVLAASNGFERPDVTFFLDAASDVRASRMADRGSRERYEDPELQDRLSESYAAAIAGLRTEGHRIEEVDATAPAASVLEDTLARLDAAG